MTIALDVAARASNQGVQRKRCIMGNSLAKNRKRMLVGTQVWTRRGARGVYPPKQNDKIKEI